MPSYKKLFSVDLENHPSYQRWSIYTAQISGAGENGPLRSAKSRTRTRFWTTVVPLFHCTILYEKVGKLEKGIAVVRSLFWTTLNVYSQSSLDLDFESFSLNTVWIKKMATLINFQKTALIMC